VQDIFLNIRFRTHLLFIGTIEMEAAKHCKDTMLREQALYVQERVDNTSVGAPDQSS
jgi:hypothetical protein